MGRSCRADRPAAFWTPRRFALAVVLLYVASAGVTSVRMAGLAGTYSAKRWFATVRSEIAQHQMASIVDGYLPARVIPLALFPQAAKASRAFAPIAPRVRWNAPGETILMFDPEGRLRLADVGRVTSARPGPRFGCGYLVNGTPSRRP